MAMGQFDEILEVSDERGFLLTQDWRDEQGICVLSFVGHGERGPFELRIASRPVLFIHRDAPLPPDVKPQERREVELADFDRNPVDAIYFRSSNELRRARGHLRLAGVVTLESDINPVDRYLMERFINGSVRFSGTYTEVGPLRVFTNPKVHAADYMPRLSSLSLDIETSRSGQIHCIGYHYQSLEKNLCGVHMCCPPASDPPGWVAFHRDEAAMIEAFLADFAMLDPDVIIGWNVVGFDLPFIQKRCAHLQISPTLGRRGLPLRFAERGPRSYAYVHGRPVLDGMQSLRAAFYQFPNWRLDTVAHELLGDGKLISDTGEDKIEEIERLAAHDPAQLAAYNREDCRLVTRIFDKTNLLDMMQTRTRISGMLMERLGRSVGAFEHFYLPRLHRKGLVAPDVDDIRADQHAAGGLVLTPQPGLHHHVVIFDFISLYPSVIRTFKIDPLSRLRANVAGCKTPLGTKFSTSEHILPDFITELMTLRTQAKREKNGALSQAIKILMNSFYGVMGTPNCRLYHHDLPSSITGTGQWILRTTRDMLESWGYHVLYGDTDSVFAQLPEADTPEPYRAAERVAKRVNKELAQLLHDKFGVESALELEFEKYYSRLYLPLARHGSEGAAKRYAGRVVERDGTESLDFKGLEIVRTDWTPLAREFQRELLRRLFYDEDVSGYVHDTVTALRHGDFDAELAYTKRLRKSVEEYTTSIPQHVKAVLKLPENRRAVRSISYVMTRRGPIPTQLPHDDIDHDHYVNHQIRPIAEGVLTLLGQNFDHVTGQQLSLF
jgi:DNA polymerase-2